MKYRNKKTQAVIETACVIHGDNWEKLENQPNEKPKTPKVKKAKKEEM